MVVLLKKFIDSDHAKAHTITKGKIVKVVKGRKVPLGTVGEVFWMEHVNYDSYNRRCGETIKVGIKDSNGNKYYTYINNLEVVNPEDYYSNEQDIIDRIDKNHNNIVAGKQYFNWTN